jgi:hypothetical protein
MLLLKNDLRSELKETGPKMLAVGTSDRILAPHYINNIEQQPRVYQEKDQQYCTSLYKQ